MSDIAKCSGEGCPIRESCYRYTAPADPTWQSYITPPYANGYCVMFAHLIQHHPDVPSRPHPQEENHG